MVMCITIFTGFPQSFGQDVLGGIAPRVNRLDVNRLASYLLSRGAIGDPQYRRLIEPHTSEQRAQQLRVELSRATMDEDPSQFVRDFYLALCDLYEDDGQRSHYQFAHLLRRKGREHVDLCVCAYACTRVCMYVFYTANKYSANSLYMYTTEKGYVNFASFVTHFAMSEVGELIHLCRHAG